MGNVEYSGHFSIGHSVVTDINEMAELFGRDPKEILESFLSRDEQDRFAFVESLFEKIDFDKIGFHKFYGRFWTCMSTYETLQKLDAGGLSEENRSLIEDLLSDVKGRLNFGGFPSKNEMARALREPKSKKMNKSKFLRYLISHKKKQGFAGKHIALDIVNPDSFESLQIDVFGEVLCEANRVKTIDSKAIWFHDSFANREACYRLTSLEGIISGYKEKVNGTLY